MECTVIKVEYPGYTSHFYRKLALREDPSLLELGAIIGKSVGCNLKHMYYFSTKDCDYCPSNLIDDLNTAAHPAEPFTANFLSDLDETFTYKYGKDYNFDCTILAEKHHIDDQLFEDEYADLCALVLEGSGAGIFGNTDDNSENPENDVKEIFYSDIDATIEHVLVQEVGLSNRKGIDLSAIDFDNLDFGDDDFDEEAFMIDEMQKIVAQSIFLDEQYNKEYRRLLQTYDMNEVYQMFVDTYINTATETTEEDSDVVDNMILENIKKLK